MSLTPSRPSSSCGDSRAGHCLRRRRCRWPEGEGARGCRETGRRRRHQRDGRPEGGSESADVGSEGIHRRLGQQLARPWLAPCWTAAGQGHASGRRATVALLEGGDGAREGGRESSRRTRRRDGLAGGGSSARRVGEGGARFGVGVVCVETWKRGKRGNVGLAAARRDENYDSQFAGQGRAVCPGRATRWGRIRISWDKGSGIGMEEKVVHSVVDSAMRENA